jgi:DNA-directed RNA polymerase I subunit RPA1
LLKQQVHAPDNAVDTHKTKYTLQYIADSTTARKVPSTIKSHSASQAVKPTGTQHVSGKRVSLVRTIKLDPVMSVLNASQELGCVSERFQQAIDQYSTRQSHAGGLLSGTGTAASPEAFAVMMWVKYMKSLAQPGEAVGPIAAQSVGEPSTQMTLNTFHLAGHGGANVTLGIPRLREIVMTASRELRTPMVTIPLKRGVSKEQGIALARRLTRLPLSELLRNSSGGISVKERIIRGDTGLWERHYIIALKLFPAKMMKKAFKLSFKEVSQHILIYAYIVIIIQLLSCCTHLFSHSICILFGCIADIISSLIYCFVDMIHTTGLPSY